MARRLYVICNNPTIRDNRNGQWGKSFAEAPDWPGFSMTFHRLRYRSNQPRFHPGMVLKLLTHRPSNPGRSAERESVVNGQFHSLERPWNIGLVALYLASYTTTCPSSPGGEWHGGRWLHAINNEFWYLTIRKWKSNIYVCVFITWAPTSQYYSTRIKSKMEIGTHSLVSVVIYLYLG